MFETILVIDLGTTNIKAVMFDVRGGVAAEATRPTPVVYDGDSMEIDPEALWGAVKSACGETLALEGPRVAAVTMTTMAASFIPFDAGGRSLHPAIGWADSRSIPHMRKSLAAFEAGEWIAGCGQYPLQMYLPFKIQWFAAAHPDRHSRVRKWLNVSEYIYSRLTGDGVYRTDYSIASRTMLFDIATQRWNREALLAFDVEESLLPEPVAPGTVIGGVGPEAREIGFPPNAAVVMGGHDHMCCVPGAGVREADTLLNTTGTSEAMVTLLPDAPFDTDRIVRAWLNCEAAMQNGRTAVVGYTGSPGRVFQSVRETLGDHGEATAGVPPGSAPIFIPPYRAQLTSVGGEFRGLPPQFDAPLLYRSICDGLYLECRRLAERIMLVQGGAKAKSVRMVGGHAKNLPEVRRKSAAFGLPIEIVRHPHITSLGAAVVAAAGLGWHPSFPAALDAMCPETTVTIEPDRSLARQFEDVYMERYLPCFSGSREAL